MSEQKSPYDVRLGDLAGAASHYATRGMDKLKELKSTGTPLHAALGGAVSSATDQAKETAASMASEIREAAARHRNEHTKVSNYSQKLAFIADAVRSHGLHKVAAIVMRGDGVEPPAEWTDEGVGLSLGTKLARDYADRIAIADGLTALAQVL